MDTPKGAWHHTLLRGDDAISGWVPWALWMAAVAAWCGFGFDDGVGLTGKARGLMWACLGLTAVGGVLTWRSPEWGFGSRLAPLWAAAGLTGVTLFACGLFLPGRVFRMYVTPKTVVLYPTAALLAGWLLLQLTRASTRAMLLRHPLVWLFAAMFVHLLINTAVSAMPAVTFFGSVNRQMGAVTVFACMAAALTLLVWISRDREPRARWFLFAWMALSLLWVLRTYYELTMPGVRVFRPSGFSGNPDYFALQFHFTLLPALVMVFTERSRKVAVFCAVVAAANLFALATIQTRGAWLGLGVASTVAFFAFPPGRFLPVAELRARLAAFAGLLGLAFLLHYVYTGVVLPPEAELAKLPAAQAENLLKAAERMLSRRLSAAIFVLITLLPFLARVAWDAFPQRRVRAAGIATALLAAVVLLSVPSARRPVLRVADKAVHLEKMLDPDEGEARFRVWKDTLPMVRDHLWTGVGRETYRVRFLPYKSLELTAIAPGVNYRSSHNLVLDQLAMEGVFGLLITLSLLGFGIVLGLRAARRGPEPGVSLPLFGMSLAIAGYLGHSLVIYDVIPSLFSLYAALGVIGGLVATAGGLPAPDGPEAQEPAPYLGLRRPAWLLLLPVALAVYPVISAVKVVRADQALVRIQKHSALLQAFAKIWEPLAVERMKLDELSRVLDHPSSSSLSLEQLRTLGASVGLPVERLAPEPAAALAQLRQAAVQLRDALRVREARVNREAESRSVSAAVAGLLQDLRLVMRVADPGETVYNAAHAAHVLTRVPERFLSPHDRMDILRLLTEAARLGVPDNTNPESAWSRVFTTHYALARALEGAGRWAEAHSQYRKSLDAIQKSIDFDRLYYDTHRLKAVLLLEHYCDAEGARAELDEALRILRRARPSRLVKEALEAIEKGPRRQLEAWSQSPAGRERCLRELERATSGNAEPSRTGTRER